MKSYKLLCSTRPRTRPSVRLFRPIFRSVRPSVAPPAGPSVRPRLPWKSVDGPRTVRGPFYALVKVIWCQRKNCHSPPPFWVRFAQVHDTLSLVITFSHRWGSSGWSSGSCRSHNHCKPVFWVGWRTSPPKGVYWRGLGDVLPIQQLALWECTAEPAAATK